MANDGDTKNSVKRYKKRAVKAWERRRYYDALLRDVYDYAMPYRDPAGLQSIGNQQEGAKRVNRIFDATAVKAGFRFAGRIQTELTPIFQTFFSIEAGPLITDEKERKTLTEEFQKIGRIVHGVMASGEYHNAAHEGYLDLYAGTYHMLILDGDDKQPARFLIIPIPEVAIELGPYNNVEGWHWKRCWPAEELPELWPNGKFSDTIKRMIKDNPDGDVEVCQYTYLDRKSGKYRLVAWTKFDKDTDDPFFNDEYRTSPWVTARFFKVPNEAYGRGPVNLAMPTIKTTNAAVELALKAATIAIMGIWTYRNDGVFNPKTAKFDPRAMWAVQSNSGGVLGRSIERLPTPENFDISSIVINEQREQMKQTLFDDTLPPETGAVRSATEIAERISRLSQDLSGVYGRLTLEIVVPTVQRVIDILEKKGLLKTSITIDQMLTQVRVIAPIASGQQAAKVQAYANAMQMVMMLGGQEALMLAFKVEQIFPKLARWLGVDEEDLRSDLEKGQIVQHVAKIMAQQQQAAAAAKQQPPNPAQQAQQLVNGAAA